MKPAIIGVFTKELSALAAAAFTIAVGCGILLQLFDTSGLVVLFAFSAGTVFGIFGGGFRKSPRVLEFLLTRNISRKQFYFWRWTVCVVPLVLSVALVGVNIFMPISNWFWSLFVESGFSSSSSVTFSNGFGWFLFAVFGSLWSYSATFALVARTKSISSMLIALLVSIVVVVAVILLYMACASILCSFGIIKTIRLYEPGSGVWISFYAFSLVLCFLSVVLGIRHFNRIDIT